MSVLRVDRFRLVEATMMTVRTEIKTMSSPPDDYYTPQRICDLLQLYVYLGDSRLPSDDDLGIILRRVLGPDGWKTEAAAKRADIWRALVWLENRSVEMPYVIRAAYCVGLDIEHIMPYVRSHLRSDATEATVANWRDDGVKMMSDYLCGRVK